MEGGILNKALKKDDWCAGISPFHPKNRSHPENGAASDGRV